MLWCSFYTSLQLSTLKKTCTSLPALARTHHGRTAHIIHPHCSPSKHMFLTAPVSARYLIVSVRNGCEPTNRLWYVDLERIPRHKDSGALDLGAYDLNRGETGKLLPLVKLVDTFEAQWEVVANEGPVFTLLTNHSAPRYRLACLEQQSVDVHVGT